MFWGYSASVDFQNELDNWDNEEEAVNILILGAGDARHILETISKYYRHKRQVKINFYIAEVLMELIARQILLLLTAFEPSKMLGLKEKVHLWMEIYGNILVRPNTAKYISQKSQQLIQAVTDFDYLKYRLPMVCLDLFKYKERDLLEVVFKFWSQENHDYNVVQHWDSRLRKSLGVR
ncbi:hypothetical protein LSTR_LSTR017384 [Laodelphax striatellus]|nr:hypothetical protein LSTR_LSTR017384 [Laodelphax striatellus]